MKKTFFLCLFLAIACYSFGQFGPPVDEKPGPIPTCHPDLFIGSVGAFPQTATVGSVISFPITVKQKGECHIPATQLQVMIEYLPYQFHYLTVSVPAFTPYIQQHTVTVNYTVTPASLYGLIYLGQITADVTNVVAESNESNNYKFVLRFCQVI